jgi:hypothetical protein
VVHMLKMPDAVQEPVLETEGEMTDCTDCAHYNREYYPDDPGEFSDWCVKRSLPLDRKKCELFEREK